MKRRLQVTLGCFASICFLMQLPAQTRYHKYTKQMGDPPDLISISTSSLFGGTGNEGFVSAGFREDGKVLIGGIAFGPTFEPVRGTRVDVIGGRDGALPSLDLLARLELGPLDKARLPDEGKNSYKRRMAREKANRKIPALSEVPNGAPFVVLMNEKLNRVEKIVRLPWGTGSLTDMATGPGGEVYLTGRLDGSIKGAKALNSPYGVKEEKAKTIYLLKLSSKLNAIDWVVHRKDVIPSPEVKLLQSGEVLWVAGDIQKLSTKGRVVFNFPQVSARGLCRAVDPVNIKIARGGDHNKHTGREPWRRPYLDITNEKGEREAALYSWDPAYVGMSGRRLVSDSSIRGAEYSVDGKYLWLVGWSDGGNSVLNQQPFNLERGVKNQGMWMSMWGANATSGCYIIKMNAETYEVEVKSIWMAYQKNKNAPAAMSIEDMSIAEHGELVVTGSGGGGVIMTRNHLYRGEENPEWAPGGAYVAVFRPKVNGVRFSSVLSAVGVVPVKDRQKLEVVTGKNGNTHRAIAVGTSVKEHQSKYDLKPLAYPTTGNALQAKFGGGFIDGSLILLEWQN